MSKTLNIQFEKAVRFLVEHLPISNETSRKPLLFHDIRVGTYLYENKYSDSIVIAGVLHDILEWSNATEKMVKDEFGDNVVTLILANTKNDTITDKEEKTTELIQRCIETGEDALIVKAADVLDSFKWYSQEKNEAQLAYCMRNANAILKYKPNNFNDKIFDELKLWTKT